MLCDDGKMKWQWLWQVSQKGLSIKKFWLQVKSFACTAQQPLCPGGDRETSQGHTTLPEQGVRQRQPCWGEMLHHSMCQPCCQWDSLETTARSPGAEMHPSLKTCSQMLHLCPTGVWERNARVRVQSVGGKQGKESPAFISTRLKRACSKPNQTIIQTIFK